HVIVLMEFFEAVGRDELDVLGLGSRSFGGVAFVAEVDAAAVGVGLVGIGGGGIAGVDGRGIDGIGRGEDAAAVEAARGGREMEIVFQSDAAGVGLVAEHRMLCADARWTSGGRFGGSYISSCGIVGRGILEQR